METLYSGLSELALQNTVILWATLYGFNLPTGFSFQSESMRDKVYDDAWFYLLNDEDYLYEIEQDLDEIWHLTRIGIETECISSNSSTQTVGLLL